MEYVKMAHIMGMVTADDSIVVKPDFNRVDDVCNVFFSFFFITNIITYCIDNKAEGTRR